MDQPIIDIDDAWGHKMKRDYLDRWRGTKWMGNGAIKQRV